MPSFLRGRPSASMVISVVALFAALAGSAVAANLITGKDVKNSSLTGKDVKNSSLTGKDVKNSSLTGTDVKDKSLTAKDFIGSVQGRAGAAGPTGPVGPAGPVSLQYLTGNPVTLPAGGNVTATVACPTGKSVTGGGATILTIGPDVIMDSSYPSDDASDADAIRDNAWSVAYNNPTASASSFLVYAICTTASSKS